MQSPELDDGTLSPSSSMGDAPSTPSGPLPDLSDVLSAYNIMKYVPVFQQPQSALFNTSSQSLSFYIDHFPSATHHHSLATPTPDLSPMFQPGSLVGLGGSHSHHVLPNPHTLTSGALHNPLGISVMSPAPASDTISSLASTDADLASVYSPQLQNSTCSGDAIVLSTLPSTVEPPSLSAAPLPEKPTQKTRGTRKSTKKTRNTQRSSKPTPSKSTASKRRARSAPAAKSPSSPPVSSPATMSESSPENLTTAPPAAIMYAKSRSKQLTESDGDWDFDSDGLCPHCEVTINPHEQQRHRQQHYRDDEQEFVCCGDPVESFLTGEEYDRENVVSWKGSEWVGGCWKGFSRKDALRRHVENGTHALERKDSSSRHGRK